MRLRAHADVTAVVQPAPHVRERLEAMKAEAGGGDAHRAAGEGEWVKRRKWEELGMD